MLSSEAGATLGANELLELFLVELRGRVFLAYQ
jgi:hypothetical protein